MRAFKREIMNITEDICHTTVKKGLGVPGLVGEGLPYSTLSNFLSQFHKKQDRENKDLVSKIS